MASEAEVRALADRIAERLRRDVEGTQRDASQRLMVRLVQAVGWGAARRMVLARAGCGAVPRGSA